MSGLSSSPEEVHSLVSLVDIPDDVWRMIIGEWLVDDSLSLSNLDVAFCHHGYRLQYLSWVKGTLLLSSAEQPTYVGLFYQWLVARGMYIVRATIDAGSQTFMTGKNIQLLSKVTEYEPLGVFEHRKTGMSYYSKFSSLTSIRCCLHHVNGCPFQWLPHPEKLRTCILDYYTKTSTPMPWSNLDPTHPGLRSLTNLTISSNYLDGAVIVNFCAQLRDLRVLRVNSISASIVVPSRDLWSSFPPLLQVQTLEIPQIDIYVRASDALAYFLLDRCSNVTVLTLQSQGHADALKVILLDVAPKLTKLNYKDYRSRTKLSVEAKEGTLCDTVSPGQRQAIQRLSGNDAALMLTALTILFRSNTAAKKSFDVRLLTNADHSKVPKELLDAKAVTHIDLDSVRMTAEVWVQLLQLPLLQYLHFQYCVTLLPSAAVGLNMCEAAGIVARHVTSLRIEHGWHYSDKEFDCEKVWGMVLSMLPRVFPSLENLELLFFECSPISFVTLLRCLPHLRKILLHGDHVLPEMTVAQWQEIAAQSQCRCWTVEVYSFRELPHVQRMLDGLQRLARTVTLYLPGGRKAYRENCAKENFMLRWHGSPRNFTLMIKDSEKKRCNEV